MNIGISEKIVNYRLNSQKKQEVNLSIGSYIKKERVSQGLNQDYVCKGICSVSYYSRIENGEKIPDQNYIEKIFKRLKKPIPQEYLHQDVNRELINNLLAAIEYKNDAQLNQFYLNHKNKQKHELIDLVFYLYQDKFNEAEQTINILDVQQRYFKNEDLLLYLELISYFYYKKLDFDKAKKYILLAFEVQSMIKIEKPMLYYLYAKILDKSNDEIKCMDYIMKAEELFKSTNNVYRTIQCQILMANKLSQSYFEKAKQLYHNVLKSTLHHGYIDLFKRCSIKIVKLYKKNQLFDQSIAILKQLLNDFGDDYDLIERIYVEYIDIYILNKKIDEASQYLDKYKSLCINAKPIYIKYFEAKINNYDLSCKLKLFKHEFIPFCIKSHNYNLEKRIRKEYSQLLENNNMLKESIAENKKIIHLLEKGEI